MTGQNFKFCEKKLSKIKIFQFNTDLIFRITLRLKKIIKR